MPETKKLGVKIVKKSKPIFCEKIKKVVSFLWIGKHCGKENLPV
jgi:hypothetical protein